MSSRMCAQRRLKSARASAQSDQSLRYPMNKLCILGYLKRYYSIVNREDHVTCAGRSGPLMINHAITTLFT